MSQTEFPQAQAALQKLEAAKDLWAQTSVEDRIAILRAIKDRLMQQAEAWALLAARKKRLPADSPLLGEEWLSGPYALMTACNALILTLSKMKDKAFLKDLPQRHLPNGQLALQVMPHSLWDRLLLSGMKAEVWMQPHVTPKTLKAASLYDQPPKDRRGKLALVLGAGNVAAISPLDAFHKLFNENEVVILKLNPVNDYLYDVLCAVLQPLIARDALHITRGGSDLGNWLTNHPLVETIHITGSGATHDAIVWGSGTQGAENRLAGRPENPRPITSELGAVCPTIVVSGEWSKADLAFQAEQIATQKLQNSGFNCIAMQILILPEGWPQAHDLLDEIRKVMARYGQREAYYPQAEARLAEFAQKGDAQEIPRGPIAPPCQMADLSNPKADEAWLSRVEIFAPAFGVKWIKSAPPEVWLTEAISYANKELYGTLGANIVIHPKVIQLISKNKFDQILTDLHYGTIAINTWSALGFAQPACPWGGYPGATIAAPGSGIGTVHNSFMLEQTERVVIQAPFHPFPRGLAFGQFSTLPRPPWFITHKTQAVLGRLLTRFQYRPSWRQLPRIILNALRG